MDDDVCRPKKRQNVNVNMLRPCRIVEFKWLLFQRLYFRCISAEWCPCLKKGCLEDNFFFQVVVTEGFVMMESQRQRTSLKPSSLRPYSAQITLWMPMNERVMVNRVSSTPTPNSGPSWLADRRALACSWLTPYSSWPGGGQPLGGR